MSAEIRPAERGDIPAILGLIRELAEYEKLESQAVAQPETMEYWLFERRTAEALVAIGDGGEYVGFTLFFHNFSTFLGKAGIYIEDIYVRPEHRGSGIGLALIRRVAAVAQERGCGRIEWSCLDWNEPSIKFYKQLGAVPMDGWTQFRVTGEAIAELAGNK